MGSINLKHTGSGSAIALSSDGTNLLLNGTAVGGGGGSSTLDGLSDVSTSGVSSGQVLKYNGTNWTPASDNTASGGGGSGITTGKAIAMAMVFG